MKQKFLQVAFAIACLFLSNASLLYATMSSPNFQVQSDVMGSFGGDASSSLYSVNGTGGEPIVGPVTGVNTNGNQGYWQNDAVVLPSATFSVDVVNEYYVKITGSGTYPGTVMISMTGNDNDGSVTETYGPITIEPDGTFSFTTGILNEGTYAFTATITTPQGTVSATPSGPTTAEIDLGPIDNFSVTVHTDGNVTISGQGFPNSEVKIKILDDQGNVVMTVTDTTDGNGDFSKLITGLSAGDYSATAAMFDGASAQGPYDPTKKFVIPDTAIDTSIETSYSVRLKNLYYASVSGNAPYPGEVMIYMTGSDASGTFISQTFGPVTVQSDGTFQFITETLNAGHYEFTVSSVGSSGTISLKPQGDSFVDVVLGAVENLVATVQVDKKVITSGDSFPSGKVEVIVRDEDGNIIFQELVQTDGAGHFTLSSTQSLLPGTYTMYVTMLDTRGSRSAVTSKRPLIIDGTPEAILNNTLIDTEQDTTLLGSVRAGKEKISETLDAIEAIGVDIAQNVGTDTGLFSGAVALTAAAAALTPVVLGSAALNTVIPSVVRFIDFMGRLLFGLFGGKRKKAWGVVYDGSNGKPIPTAVVSLINVAKGNVIETKITDKYGSYFFFVLPGEYEIRVKKDGYVLPKSLDHESIKAFYKDMYLSGTLTVTKEDILHKDIPMISDKRVKASFARIFLHGLGKAFGLMLFYGGFLLSIYMVYKDASWLNIFLLIFYVLMLTMRNLFIGEPKPGRALTLMRKPLPFVWIKIINTETKEREARVITDENGKYYMIVDEGRYQIEAASVDNSLRAFQEIHFTKRKPLDSDIILHP